MRWLIEGANRDDGSEQVISVEARSSAEAERIAARQGLMIATVTREPASAANLLASMVGEKRVVPRLLEMPREQPYPDPSSIDRDLRLGRSILLLLAMVVYVIAAGAFAGSLASLWRAVESGDFAMSVALGTIALVSAVLAAMMHATSAMCGALIQLIRSRFARH